ncbi:MAG: isoprenyl transferase [Ruminococcus sp.]|nr:isoprenyl transferase [Ruminococcus sp.]
MAIFKKAEKKLTLNDIVLPEHIGIIMDGNGRWAKKRGLPRTAGHTVGAQTFRKIARYCSDIGIKHLTVYAFSTENWKRPKEEVDAIMKLFKEYMIEAINDFQDDSIVVKFIGDRTVFPDDMLELIEKNEHDSKDRTGMVLNIAMNYGGRDEIVNAVKTLAKDVKDGKVDVNDIDDKLLSDLMYTSGQPDPDLIIRPSGEYRTSNFLLWQSAYSEYCIMDVLWPDFKTEDLDKALIEFAKRNRRFGGI